MEQTVKEKLLEVEKELSQWRKSNNGHRGRETPDSIRKQVVELLSEYSAWQLQKRLGINSVSIRSWKEHYSSEPVFISLPPVVVKEKVTESLPLKFSRSNEGIWSIEGELSLKDWQSAIRLLEGVS